MEKSGREGRVVGRKRKYLVRATANLGQLGTVYEKCRNEDISVEDRGTCNACEPIVCPKRSRARTTSQLMFP